MKLLVILVFSTCALAYNVQRNRIIGGDYASEGQFPYQISQRVDGGHFCGGSIINENTILTAAHCVHGVDVSTIEVVVGSLTLDGGVYHNVLRYVKHEDYNIITVVNDIAVMKLQTSIQYTMNVQPIDIDDTYINTGAETVVAGWGLTSWPGVVASHDLLYFYGKVYDWKTCKADFEGSRYPVVECHICNYASYGHGVCKGDSGGALVVNGRHAGVASWARLCAVGAPDVFTRTYCYVDWIKKQ